MPSSSASMILRRVAGPSRPPGAAALWRPLYARAIALLVMVWTLASCAASLPRTDVIREPSGIVALHGERPWLFVRHMPFDHAGYLVKIQTPGGGAYLRIGGALASVYDTALGGFFSVSLRSSTGAGQYAFTDFDGLEFESTLSVLENPPGTPGRARLGLRLRHSIRVTYRDFAPLERIPVDASIEAELRYGDEGDFLRQASGLAAQLLERVERDVFRYIVENDRPDKYLAH